MPPPTPQLAEVHDTTTAAAGTKGRSRHTRTRAGCLTCRTRKKKCDEVKPRCAGCRRNMLACEWPPAVLQYYPVLEEKEGSSVGGVQPAPPTARLTVASPTYTAATVSTHPPAPVRLSPPALHPPPSSPGVSSVYLAGGSERACSLTPQSVTLLSHYIRETAGHFAMTPMRDNPFVSILLPLGYADDLLMHSMLALSGAHLAFNEPGNVEVATATRLHYSRLIGGLRQEFALLREDDLERKERLLRVLMVMCHYEAVSGDTQGNIFNHLRASRNLIQSLLAHKPADEKWSSFRNEALGFVIELYTYLKLTNSVTYCASATPLQPLDPWVMSLEEMVSFPTFGVLFAGCQDLYRLIPEIHKLAYLRLAEEGTGSDRASATLRATHNDLYDRIASWEMPPAASRRENVEDHTHRRYAAETLREGLYIYLATAIGGSLITEEEIRGIQDHVRTLFSYAPALAASQYSTAMLWPLMIAGACVVRPEEQQMLLDGIRTGRHSMGHLTLLTNILQRLYDDPDPRAYGLYGLYITMRKHGLSITIA